MNWTIFLVSIVALTSPNVAYGELSTFDDLGTAWDTSNRIELTSTDENYDFIIIGGGSAGSVIANRLSEIATWKILLLEAGLPENSLAEFPALTSLLHFTNYNWGYTIEPQPHACLAMENQRCPWPRGKALGGSSVTNLMIYTRGNPEDYNRWAALGNRGWSYADVLPYFLKSEDARLNNSQEAYHNRGGYLSVENAPLTEFGRTFIYAGKELGFSYIDHNSASQIGFSRLQVTAKMGRRHSTATAFILPALHRENLKVLTGAKVTRILIDPLTNSAFGVEYLWRNNKFVIKATKEVILSAGVINSPQILMLSGIGPKSHLDELGIVTLKDLPVGQTLYDHVSFAGPVITTNFTMPAPNVSPVDFLQFYTSGEGRLASFLGFEAVAFVKTYMSLDNDYPDIELLFGVGSIRSDNGTIGRRFTGITESYFNQMYWPAGATTDLTMDLAVLHPKSKGFIKLRSSNPLDAPLIYANYFTDPENHDLKTLVAGVRLSSKLCETQAFQRYNARILQKPFVGCEHLPFDSDEHWECAMQLLTRTAYHPTSTCKMGPPSDPTAVVNSELKVYGIQSLRVADASVIPLLPSGHTNAPSIMIGEKVSDIIKSQWGVFNY